MTMDPMVVATAIGLVITTLAGGMVTVIVAFGKMRREQIAVLQQLAAKTDEVHDLVNGSAHTAAAKLSDLEHQILGLHARIAALQEQRVQDAQANPKTEKDLT